MRDGFDIRFVNGHVEVYDLQGNFCFSADSMGEVQEELRELAQAA